MRWPWRRHFPNGERLVVLLGESIERSLASRVQAFGARKRGARVLLKAVGDAERYRVAAIDERRIISIEEEPSRPKSNYAVVSCYM